MQEVNMSKCKEEFIDMADSMDVDCDGEMLEKKDSDDVSVSDSRNKSGSPSGGSTVTDCDNPETTKTDGHPVASSVRCAEVHVGKETPSSSVLEDHVHVGEGYKKDAEASSSGSILLESVTDDTVHPPSSDWVVADKGEQSQDSDALNTAQLFMSVDCVEDEEEERVEHSESEDDVAVIKVERRGSVESGTVADGHDVGGDDGDDQESIPKASTSRQDTGQVQALSAPELQPRVVLHDFLRNKMGSSADTSRKTMPKKQTFPPYPHKTMPRKQMFPPYPHKTYDDTDTSVGKCETLKITAVRSLAKAEDLPSQKTAVTTASSPAPQINAFLYGAPKISGRGQLPGTIGLNLSSETSGPHITLPSGVKVPVSIASNPTTGLLEITAAAEPFSGPLLALKPVVKEPSSGPDVKAAAGKLPVESRVKHTAARSESLGGQVPVTRGVRFTVVPQSGKHTSAVNITSGKQAPKAKIKDLLKPSQMPVSSLPDPPAPLPSEWASLKVDVKGCIVCGKLKYRTPADTRTYGHRLITKTRVENLDVSHFEILSELFPSIVKCVKSRNDWICSRCGLDVGNLFKAVQKTNTLRSSILKKMEAAFPARDNNSAVSSNKDIVKSTPPASMVDLAPPVQPAPPVRRKLPVRTCDKHVQTPDMGISKGAQTRLSVSVSDSPIPPGVLMTASKAADQLEKSIEMSTQEYCINDSKERGYALRVQKPQRQRYDTDDDMSDAEEVPPLKKPDAKPARGVVLIQVPRGPVSSVGAQTYNTKHVAQNVLNNLGSVSLERVTDADKEENKMDDEQDKEEEEPAVFIRGQCAVCGAIPNQQYPFQFLYTQRTGIKQFLLKFCGTFLFASRATCICHDCKKHVLGFKAGIQQLTDLCKRNAPSIRSLGQSKTIKQKKAYIISERASDNLADRQEELLAEHGYAVGCDQVPTSHTAGKRRKVALPGVDLATNSASLKTVVASRAVPVKRMDGLKTVKEMIAARRVIVPKPSNHPLPMMKPVVQARTNPFAPLTNRRANDLIAPIEIPWRDEVEVTGSDMPSHELPSLPYVAK